jgi:large subunit ribosomal protein L9
MKVILVDDVIKVGSAGEVKEVAEGFARNYLIPQKLALAATEANIRRWESEKRVRQIHLNQKLESAQKLGAELGKLTLEISAKAGREGHLFGSITSQAIAEALLAKSYAVDRKNIIIETPIKDLGDYKISVRLHSQVTASIPVRVVSSNPEDQEREVHDAPEAAEETVSPS